MGSIGLEEKTRDYLTHGDPDEFNPELWSSGRLPDRQPETHLNVLIVGAGPSGLMTALECWRKGHNVVGILERSKGPVYTGDLVIIAPSAITVFKHWPDMLEDLEADKRESSQYYYKHTGEHILGPTRFTFNEPDVEAEIRRAGNPVPGPNQIRKQFFRTLLKQVARIGLRVEYDTTVAEYFEVEAAGVAGVVLSGSRAVRVADLVVAADATRTRSDLLIHGRHQPAKSSGMSVYRCSMPPEIPLQDPAFRERWGEAIERGESSHEFWLGRGMHLNMAISPKIVAFGLTPRDSTQMEGGVAPIESWQPDVDPEQVLEVLRRTPGWPAAVESLIKSAPKGSVVHWPLMWRNLQESWTSQGGLVVQVGDAAHSTIPASASGATLALEDAVTLASCLQLSCINGGKQGASLGARVYNMLRYQRVACSQKAAFVNSEILARANMEEISKNPEKAKIHYPKWLFMHDPEKYAYDNYGSAVANLLSGAPFQNTNIPPGHKFSVWTMEGVLEEYRSGKKAADFLDGDWS
ncbi:hypothetical protein CB0940_02474 [Cercospora beticola]|uniref:FAD-binding domain-containing protein n=1 Tax=Cercospora beticola TaxID=122368 RepID=A0A2G5I4R9_CERBT|nr:hypothetical protein CB0940_02474 [Cercospora beticola]PIA99770.1 hypothetical protein CB0940_02474 [Cercospora beticola]WPA99609.1 hypothetical protein RHO25_004227 [Cercospora beticola]